MFFAKYKRLTSEHQITASLDVCMAHTDSEKSGLSESLSNNGTVEVEQEDLAGKAVADRKDASSPASTIHPPNSNVLSNVTGSSSTSHPKKFSSVTINKKFLEKNSSTPSTAQSSSNFSAAKLGVANRLFSHLSLLFGRY
jgi:hypothetical protein